MASDNHTCRLLFVYGTLRRHSQHEMARFLERSGRFLGSAQLSGRLFDLGSYPGLLPPETESDLVRGDLFELSDPVAAFDVLDRYEGCDRGQYSRNLAQALLADGPTLTAWAYFYQGAVHPGQRILSGEYQGR